MIFRYILLLCFGLQTLSAFAQTAGQYQVLKRRTDGKYDSFGVTLINGQAIGQSAGIPAAITLPTPDWGSIGGTLADQVDLKSALDGKEPTITTGSLALSKLATNPLARANHTGTQLLSTISDAGSLASLSAVDSTQITDGSIVNADISSSAAIADAKISSAAQWNAKESALTFSTGLTRSVNTITVNAVQSITRLSNLNTNGFIKASGANGTLSIDTSTYLTGNQAIALSGDATGTGTTSIPVTLANSGATAGTYGSATESIIQIVDSKGRITSIATQTITPAESSVTFTDIATNNASTTKHGYLKKLSGNSEQFLDGTGNFTTPASILTIGTSTIASGTSGYVLYNNAGFLGQLATTGSGSVVRATSPTLSDALITGYTYFGDSNNWARRNLSTGDTEFNSPTSQFKFLTSGSSFLTVSSTGISPVGIIAGLGYSVGVPGSYPTIPSYEQALSGRSFRPGINTTAFANVVMVPGDIYDGTGITITDAATLYVQGEPYQHPSGAAIGGNKWALWIAHGPSRFDGPVTVGSGGAAISKVLTGAATLDFDLTAAVVADLTLTVTGAAVGDIVVLGVPAGSVTTTAQFSAWVSSANTITVRCRTSAAGENPDSGTFRTTIIQH